MDSKTNKFFEGQKNWEDELFQLRQILLDCGLEEQFKWRVPCYVVSGKNIALINGFKKYCAIGFFKGALLLDNENVLVQQSENVQSSRLLTFQSVDEITKKKALIRSYIYEAIELEKAGLNVQFKRTDEFPVPDELTNIFELNSELKQAFERLTPGRQRGYLLHFNGAKQSSTRTDRIMKCEFRIMKGKGLNDCICGKSKRMPNCDGSHKNY